METSQKKEKQMNESAEDQWKIKSKVNNIGNEGRKDTKFQAVL